MCWSSPKMAQVILQTMEIITDNIKGINHIMRFLRFFLKFISMPCVCYVWWGEGAIWTSEEIVRSPGTRVTGGCELPGVDAKIQTRSSRTASSAFACWALSLARCYFLLKLLRLFYTLVQLEFSFPFLRKKELGWIKTIQELDSYCSSVGD